METEWFKDDTRSVGVGSLSIDNGIGSVVVHGSLTLTPDAASIEQLATLRKRLSELESALASVIEEGAFSGAETAPVLETVDNPFA